MRIRIALLFVLVTALGLLLAACGDDDDKTLTVITHDSFNLSEDLIRQFEEEHGATVKLLQKGDAGSMTTSLVLTKGKPEGDVAFGIDNTFLSRALDEGVFEKYESPLLEKVPAEFKTEGSGFVTPIDYGYVNFNYDIAELERRGIAAPESLEDLTRPEYRDLTVVENPASSSPGLAFLVATVAYFGEDGYLDWWRAMRANGLVVTDGWETAYNTNFSLHGGEQPIVLSYATSPAFEQLFADPPREDAPTANLLPPKGVFRQIEYAGVLNGTKKRDLARAFIDFLLSVPVQEDIPGQMAVYPVNREAKVPEAFVKFSEVTVPIADISAADIAANRQKWIDEWTKAVLR
ncbi:MAG TPA: thiamine ABC transporter substrate-binding protein [Tepidiformaceae bacterium]|jgi:thiamine transport system substrate-binding protein|nr:thiamine ABC transporter substrate-binding protein [Tepidiformaceae bacterium]